MIFKCSWKTFHLVEKLLWKLKIARIVHVHIVDEQWTAGYKIGPVFVLPAEICKRIE